MRLLTLLVITPAAGGMDQPAGDTRDEQCVWNLEFHSMINRLFRFFEHRVEFRSLRYGSGKTIKYKAEPSQWRIVRSGECSSFPPRRLTPAYTLHSSPALVESYSP